MQARRRRIALVLAGLSIASLAVAGPAAAQYTKKPSKLVHLGSGNIVPNNNQDLLTVSPTASFSGAFQVPAGQVFVMTSLVLTPLPPATGSITVALRQTSGGGYPTRESWTLPATQPTQFLFPVGMVFASGWTLNVSNAGTSATGVKVVITGYLAPDV